MIEYSEIAHTINVMLDSNVMQSNDARSFETPDEESQNQLLFKASTSMAADIEAPPEPAPEGQLIVGGDGDDTIVGGDGDDTIVGGVGASSISGGDGDDAIRTYRDNNTLNGGDGDDILSSFGNSNTLNGGEGDDIINIYGGDNNTINGGDGNDTISLGGGDNNTIDAGDGNDTISLGGGDNNTIDAGDGNDTIYAGGGDNTISGGDGDDTVAFRGDQSDYTVTENEDGSYTVEGPDGTNYLEADVEFIQFGHSDPIQIADAVTDQGGGDPVEIDGPLTDITAQDLENAGVESGDTIIVDGTEYEVVKNDSNYALYEGELDEDQPGGDAPDRVIVTASVDDIPMGNTVDDKQPGDVIKSVSGELFFTAHGGKTFPINPDGTLDKDMWLPS